MDGALGKVVGMDNSRYAGQKELSTKNKKIGFELHRHRIAGVSGVRSKREG